MSSHPCEGRDLPVQVKCSSNIPAKLIPSERSELNTAKLNTAKLIPAQLTTAKLIPAQLIPAKLIPAKLIPAVSLNITRSKSARFYKENMDVYFQQVSEKLSKFMTDFDEEDPE